LTNEPRIGPYSTHILTKLIVKLLANSLPAIGAILCLLFLLLTPYYETQINDLGEHLVEHHNRFYRLEARKILAHLNDGQIDSALKSFEKSEWASVLYNDRAYLHKRRVLSLLCKKLEAMKDYERLIQLASQWRQLHDRDIDAMAYWYEALRHSPDRKKEGLQGLIKGLDQFPSNALMTTFLFKAYLEVDDHENVEKLLDRRVKIAAKIVLSGWKLHWTTKTKLTKNKLNSRAVTISTDGTNFQYLTFELPPNTTRLRLDPPPFLTLSLSEIQLEIDGITQDFSESDVALKQMQHKNNSIVTLGQRNPYFYFKTRPYLKKSKNDIVHVVIRFRLALIIEGYELPLAKH
jgi:hypothetical protein